VKRIRLLLLILLTFGVTANVYAGRSAGSDEDNINADNSSAQKQHDEKGWVEKNINPGTEWIEGLMTPFNRWVEKNIQDEPATQTDDRLITDFNGIQPTAGVISPQEAARLVLLLEPGRVVKVEYIPSQPPAYVLRLLDNSGLIQHFYLNATDGTLLDDAPLVSPESGATQDVQQ